MSINRVIILSIIWFIILSINEAGNGSINFR